MRILLTHVYGWPEVRRGGERYLHELASSLQRAGHQVTVLTTAPEAHIETVLNVEVRYLKRRRVYTRRYGELASEVAFGGQALWHALAMKFDVWHALGTVDAAAAALMSRLRGTVSVYTDLGIPLRPYRLSRPDAGFYRYVVRHIDRYLTLSPTAGQILEQDWERRAEIVGGGVDTSHFQPSQRSSRPTILYSGTLNAPRKNVRLLVKAVTLIAREIPDLQLLLSGPGDVAPILENFSPDVRARVVSCGLGDPEDVIRHYGNAWVTVLPSSLEAFGLVLVESLACGTPVVALNGAGPGDIVTPRVGVTAEANPQSLAQACLKALAMSAEPDIATRCRDEALAYDWDTAIVPKLERLYQHP